MIYYLIWQRELGTRGPLKNLSQVSVGLWIPVYRPTFPLGAHSKKYSPQGAADVLLYNPRLIHFSNWSRTQLRHHRSTFYFRAGPVWPHANFAATVLAHSQLFWQSARPAGTQVMWSHIKGVASAAKRSRESPTGGVHPQDMGNDTSLALTAVVSQTVVPIIPQLNHWSLDKQQIIIKNTPTRPPWERSFSSDVWCADEWTSTGDGGTMFALL